MLATVNIKVAPAIPVINILAQVQATPAAPALPVAASILNVIVQIIIVGMAAPARNKFSMAPKESCITAMIR